MSNETLIRRETAALTGTDIFTVPVCYNLQISLANSDTVTGGLLVFTAQTTEYAAFEELSTGADTIDCSSPQTITIYGNRLYAIKCVSTATGTASTVKLDIRGWDE